MFNVVTVNLTPDLRTAQPDLGTCDFGEIDAGQLVGLLEVFRQLDPVQNHDAEPHVLVQAPHAKYLVRTGRGKIFIYNARDTSQPGVELDPQTFVDDLAALPPKPPPLPAVEAKPAAPFPKPRNGAAAAILCAGLLLNGYTVYSFFYVDDVNARPPITVVTNERELAPLRNSVVGRYATGTESGDRAMEIHPDDRVSFFKVTSAGLRPDYTDTYRIGYLDGKVCLATRESGLIEITNIDRLVYYRDGYRRTDD